jgi:hypothetical protein
LCPVYLALHDLKVELSAILVEKDALVVSLPPVTPCACGSREFFCSRTSAYAPCADRTWLELEVGMDAMPIRSAEVIISGRFCGFHLSFCKTN